MAIVNLSSPMVEHYRKIEAFFAQDKGVFVVYDNKDREVRVYVADPDKAEAIQEILKSEVVFGNEVLTVKVIPGNATDELKKALAKSLRKSLNIVVPTYSEALLGNNALSYIKTITAAGDMPFTYIVFVNKVVQYFRDDLSDIHRMRSTLYEDLAR